MEPFGETRLITGSSYYNALGAHKETLGNSRWAFPEDIVAHADGSLTVADSFNNMTVKVDPDGKVKVIAGGGHRIPTGSGLRAHEAALIFPSHLAVTPDGKVQYFTNGLQIFKVRTAPLDEGEHEIKVSRQGGALFDVFDAEGYAVRVENTQGDTLLSFEYGDFTPQGSSARWLTGITTAHGSSINIERNSIDGEPSRITSHFNHKTDLALDFDGYLESATWADTIPSEQVRFTYLWIRAG